MKGIVEKSIFVRNGLFSCVYYRTLYKIVYNIKALIFNLLNVEI